MKKATHFFLLVFSIFVIGTPSFAYTVWLDEVISFVQPDGSSNEGGPPTDALGEPDAAGSDPDWTGFVSIDIPETLIVAFTDNTATDGPGNDIRIYEYYNGDSRAQVHASMDNSTYFLLGIANGNEEYDIANIPGLDFIRYLKFEGLDNGGGSAGFDLDAVEALNSIPIPGAIWLLGSGLIALVGFRKK
jgi:hypothetical protein